MEVLRSLDHANVVKYYDSALVPGRWLDIAMEYAPGGELASAIDAARDTGGGGFSETQVLFWFVQVRARVRPAADGRRLAC